MPIIMYRYVLKIQDDGLECKKTIKNASNFHIQNNIVTFYVFSINAFNNNLLIRFN